ncbi:MAG TPA: glycerophosphodiester phosphodiesterase [Alphaproteobacteria bacterium]|nr:glycerophosphodiester phosphodiesterase [Alphaproteobacteria bacterium]
MVDQIVPARGLAIEHEGHRTRLKWHRLRRSLADPLFSAEAMSQGFRLGASMELDLRVRGDGGFVVLHDEVLEGETTGRGEIARLSRRDMETARLRDGRALVFSEDLAALLAAAHPEAILQFDMKDDLAVIGAAGMRHLAEQFSDLPCPVIVSGHDLDLIVAVKRLLPNLRRGIDPTDKLVARIEREGWDGVADDLVRDVEGPTEPDTVYLHWQLVLQAAARDLDLIALCHARGAKVDAWTFTLADPTGFSDAEWHDFSALLALRPDQITTDEAVATERAFQARTAAARPR